MPNLYAIAIGSNRPHGRFGPPRRIVRTAIERLERDFTLFAASPIILNRAHGPAGRDFANAVAIIESASMPPAMLSALKELEREFGRRRGKRWGPRVLDLDIAAWSGGRFSARGLTIPHPQLEWRDFVLDPLASIAPRWPIRGALTPRHLAHRLARARPSR